MTPGWCHRDRPLKKQSKKKILNNNKRGGATAAPSLLHPKVWPLRTPKRKDKPFH